MLVSTHLKLIASCKPAFLHLYGDDTLKNLSSLSMSANCDSLCSLLDSEIISLILSTTS